MNLDQIRIFVDDIEATPLNVIRVGRSHAGNPPSTAAYARKKPMTAPQGPRVGRGHDHLHLGDLGRAERSDAHGGERDAHAFLHDGAPIPPEHGGPVRLIIPQLYAWKSAKWVKGVRFLAEDKAGFWEEGGYHMRGNPWTSGDGERFRWS